MTSAWANRAEALADELAAAGHLPDPRWRAAFAATPRHVFVPQFLRDDNTLVDGTDPAQREEWLAAVYADMSLVTQHTPVPGTDLLWPTSSSTQPSLMARMLHLLDVADGHRILEIGTGTGYNAALLCHRLGATYVASIDIHPDLAHTAGIRLADLGYQPRLVVGDGAAGIPERAPHDRIIATCAVATIPPAWIEQLADDGLIVADVRGDLCSSLVVLRKTNHTAVEGRFLAVPGHFMWLRAQPDNPLRDGGNLQMRIDRDDTDQSTTNLDPALLQDPDLRFLLQHLDPGIQQPWHAQRDGTEVLVIRHTGGAWAEVATSAGPDRQVTQGGPHHLWDTIEKTTQLWHRLGRPSAYRYGLTATTEATQTLWLDDPSDTTISTTRSTWNRR